MQFRKIVLRLMTGTVPALAALAIAAPLSTRAAAPPILVDAANPATDCGGFTGKISVPDPMDAINTAPTGSTIVICPGEYTLSNQINIFNKTLTIKRAVTSEPLVSPILIIADVAVSRGMQLQNSTVTIDGLVLDARTNTELNFHGIDAVLSPVTIKNTMILGPDMDGSSGVHAAAVNASKLVGLSISNSSILGYRDTGVFVNGAIKLSLTSSHIDASDGGRVDSTTAMGVIFKGGFSGPIGPTGSVTKSRVFNNFFGIVINDTSKVSVTNNILVDNKRGVQIAMFGDARADNNKVVGNVITGVAASNFGVVVVNSGADAFTLHKFTISKNVIVADQFGSSAMGVNISSDVPATLNISGSVTGNTFIGIVTPFSTTNGPFPGVKESGSVTQP